jgi:dihydrolipoamide dehydrogenase
MAAHNIFSHKKIKPDYRVIPRCVYTKPEVASVGISEQEANEQHLHIRKGIAPFAALGRANTCNELDGFVKIITDTKGTILGGSIVGPRAGEIIHELALAMKMRAKAQDIASMIHAYPTFSEALKVACSSVE